MVLANLNEVLNHAKKKKYGVFATNIFTYDMAEVIIETAEEEKSPIILMMAEGLFRYVKPEIVAPAIITMIENTKVPIVFHLDHGNNLDVVMKCIKYGFSSIMFDGSSLPLEDNIRIMQELKKITEPLDISIEAEVGCVGGLEGNSNIKEQYIDKNSYTKVEDAIRFIEETNVDALAIAVGTIHGVFKSKPDIDFDRIAELTEAVKTPLVLHGSSGLSNEDYITAIRCGITKINYFTGLVSEASIKVREIACKKNDFTYMALNEQVMKTIKEEIKKKLDIFGSTGKG